MYTCLSRTSVMWSSCSNLIGYLLTCDRMCQNLIGHWSCDIVMNLYSSSSLLASIGMNRAVFNKVMWLNPRSDWFTQLFWDLNGWCDFEILFVLILLEMLNFSQNIPSDENVSKWPKITRIKKTLMLWLIQKYHWPVLWTHVKIKVQLFFRVQHSFRACFYFLSINTDSALCICVCVYLWTVSWIYL